MFTGMSGGCLKRIFGGYSRKKFGGKLSEKICLEGNVQERNIWIQFTNVYMK